MVNDEITYIANDARCLCAIEQLESGMAKNEWLNENAALYYNVSYGPDGFPRIADCDNLGKHYESILNFTRLYSRKKRSN